MCPMDGGHFVQAGIVSWGIDCGKNGVPGGYINLSSYVCWIKDIVEKVNNSIFCDNHSFHISF